MEKHPSETQGTHHGTILVVDDAEPIRALAAAMLKRHGFTVLGAEDGCEGVEVFSEFADEIVCVILDLTMPNMDGAACFDALRRIKEDVRVILSSGYDEKEVRKRFVGKGLAGYVQKPFCKAALIDKLHEVLR